MFRDRKGRCHKDNGKYTKCSGGSTKKKGRKSKGRRKGKHCNQFGCFRKKRSS